jgi:hypothetical protein
MPNARDSITVKELVDAAEQLKLKATDLVRALECMENLFRKYLVLPDPIPIRRDRESEGFDICFGVCKAPLNRE